MAEAAAVVLVRPEVQATVPGHQSSTESYVPEAAAVVLVHSEVQVTEAEAAAVVLVRRRLGDGG